jgi:hypothetical protein
MYAEPTLGYSPIQLKLENQHRVIPIGRLKGVLVDLYGVRTMVYFDVIGIVGNTTPYPTLLGLDWEFYNQVIINLKTMKLIFESREYIVIAPEDMNQLYKTITDEEDYVNPTEDGILS